MTAVQILSSALACAAAVVAVAGAVISYQANQRARRAVKRAFPMGSGEATVTAPMSEVDYEALKARWQATYGKAGTVCSAYQPPRTSADSGLCARCGMFDYRHQGASDA